MKIYRVPAIIDVDHHCRKGDATNEFSGYEPAHDETMRPCCGSLPEDHRHPYAAVEALEIGYGGVAYVSRVLGILVSHGVYDVVANGACSLRFKEGLIELAGRLRLALRIVHYPPYTLKRNRIEHCLFNHSA